ncbi:hypothetical protein [Streptomyces sp. NPDC058739]|uniref:hypothetical protein n=1 Tax=Streptomyces sp. NPDC058739 TaxID=3346618 RepID=UPI0036AE5765
MADAEQWMLVGDELAMVDRLVYMVVPNVFRGRADLVPADAASLRAADAADGRGECRGQERTTEALYSLLAAHGLAYDQAPSDPAGVDRQMVRQPREVFEGRRGDCLDLALIFCATALEAHLCPVLAVMLRPDHDRHTVVLIAPEAAGTPGTEPDGSLDHGAGTADELGLTELLARGWIAVDVTFATSDAVPGVVGPGSFTQAREAALSELKSAKDIRTLDIARRQSAGAVPFSADELPPPGARVESSALRQAYTARLAAAGVVPAAWNAASLEAARSRHRAEQPAPSQAGDLLDALCAGLRARPVFDSVGGENLSLAALRPLYTEHVGRAPRGAASADELLVLAASAGIAESRTDDRRDVGPLARFLLAVAGQAVDPQDIDLASISYAPLDGWITGAAGLLREDAHRYLDDEVRRRTWALLELASPVRGPGTAATMSGPTWPDRVVVDLVDPQGNVDTRNFPCEERSEQGLRDALRQATSVFLPRRGVTVDLVASREWLDAGIEHWEVVEAGGVWDPMTRDLQPRMRWSGFRHDRLRDRLDTRLKKADWHGPAAVLPEAAARDRRSTAAWLEDPSDGPGPSPYLIGCPPPGGGDPLDALLTEGCGFIVWFTTHHEKTALREACVQSDGEGSQGERRSSLPRHLTEHLDGRRTAVIWNDPQGRDGFPLPRPRRGGSLRRGGGR